MSTINTATSFPENFNFVNNPIVVEATNNTNVDGSSMHQTVIEVISPLPSGIGQTMKAAYTFECETYPGGTVTVDISSALRALIEPKEWNPEIWEEGDVIKYPTADFAVCVYDRYMRDGKIYEDTKSYHPSNASSGTGYGAHAYLGGLSELERYIQNAHPSAFYDHLTFSRKPDDTERWGAGDIKLTSKYTSSGVQTTVHRITSSEVTLPAGHRHFLFINSMGVYETVSAVMRESLSYGMESTTHSLVQAPSYKGAPILSSHKTKPAADFQMSSGYTTRAWADWWTTEFLAAKHCWMRMYLKSSLPLGSNGVPTSYNWEEETYWVPCVVTPADEDTLIYNRAEQRLPHVDFDVKLALNGSITTIPRLTT